HRAPYTVPPSQFTPCASGTAANPATPAEVPSVRPHQAPSFSVLPCFVDFFTRATITAVRISTIAPPVCVSGRYTVPPAACPAAVPTPRPRPTSPSELETHGAVPAIQPISPPIPRTVRQPDDQANRNGARSAACRRGSFVSALRP